jgi:uncharacterized membrane protein SirB2
MLVGASSLGGSSQNLLVLYNIMENFYKFASESPWLTFFLFLIVAHCIVGVFEVFRRGKK